MAQSLSRRGFLGKGLAICASLPFGGIIMQNQQKKKRDKGPRLDLDMVEEFVRVAHVNLERTKEMLELQPALVNATWDWGGGDWETGLGGASHMGNRDIAIYLLAHGARMDVFAAAMLGKLDIVKAAVAVFPNIPDVPGPHGIPLIAHAKKGGDEAVAVVKFLKGLKRS